MKTQHHKLEAENLRYDRMTFKIPEWQLNFWATTTLCLLLEEEK